MSSSGHVLCCCFMFMLATIVEDLIDNIEIAYASAYPYDQSINTSTYRYTSIASINATCYNWASLLNASDISHRNLTASARFVACAHSSNKSSTSVPTFGRASYLAFVSFSPSPASFFLSVLLDGSPARRTASTEPPPGRSLQVAWIANRQRPVADGASLQLAPDGNLLLWDADGEVAWSARTSNTGAASLVVSPSGNLQLLDASNQTVWQSFGSSTTDALLLGQTLGHQQQLVNLGLNRPSAYALHVEASRLALYASLPHPLAYWAWGSPANATSSGSATTCQGSLAATLARTDDGSYFELSLLELAANAASLSSPSNSTVCRRLNASYVIPVTIADNASSDRFFLRLEDDGNLRGYLYTSSLGWHSAWELIKSSTSACLLPNYCGDYGICVNPGSCKGCPADDSSGFSVKSSASGCSSNYKPSCTSNNNTAWEMLSISGLDYFNTKYSVDSSVNVTSKATCEQICAQNCSCAAAFYHANTSACFLVDTLEGSLYQTLDPSMVGFLKFDRRDLHFTSTRSSNSRKAWIIGLATGITGSLCIILLAISIHIRRSATMRKRHNDGEDSESIDQGLIDLAGISPTRFSFKELEVATGGFVEKLGQGGFGAVYKGVLQDGRTVAVKKLEGALQGHKEFYAEVAALGSIHHWHLVQLYGFCAEASHRLLVYEYMPNGSLGRWLFSPPDFRTPILNWQMRLDIAVGMAKGLSYLHTECKDKILHLDIKPQNVLLDGNFVAKLADFGLSRFVSREERYVFTTMRGTPGYVAPEWLLDSAITEKSDVYSFGMVLLELISGRRNHIRPEAMSETISDAGYVTENCYFPALALRMLKEKREVELVDARLGQAFDGEEAKKMVRIALLCVQEDSTRRPDMCRVVQMLDKHYGEVPDPPFTQNLHALLEAHLQLMKLSTRSSLLASRDGGDDAPANSYCFEYSKLSAR